MGSEYIIIKKETAEKTKNLNVAYLLDKLEFYFKKSEAYNKKGERIVNLSKKNREWMAEELNLDQSHIEAFLDVLVYRGLIEKDYEEDIEGKYRDTTYRIILKD